MTRAHCESVRISSLHCHAFARGLTDLTSSCIRQVRLRSSMQSRRAGYRHVEVQLRPVFT